MVAVVNGKTASLVAPSLLVELAKLPVKVVKGLLEGLLSEFCPENELLAKQFCSNQNCKYIVVTNL